MHLLHEVARGPASFWHVYLRSLPPSYTTAMCLTFQEREALQVDYAIRQVEAAVQAAEDHHRQMLPVLTALPLAPKFLSKAAWLWALSTLSSRTMYMPTDDAGALTPFGDLHNYAPPPPPVTPQLFAAQRQPNAATGDEGDGAETMWGDGALDGSSDQYCIYARCR